MRILKKLTLVLLSAVFVFSSCTKEEENIQTISNYEAAEVVNSYVTGFGEIIGKTVEELIAAALAGELCGELINFDIDETYIPSVSEYRLRSQVNLNTECFALIPTSATLSAESSLQLNSPYLISDNTSSLEGNANLNLNILDIPASDITMAASFNASGNQEINYNGKKNLLSSLVLDLTDFTILPSELRIKSGTGTLDFSASFDNNVQTFNGNIVFNEDQTVTIDFNGEKFDFDFN